MELKKIDERCKIDLTTGVSHETTTYVIGDYEVNRYVNKQDGETIYDGVEVAGGYKERFLPMITFSGSYPGMVREFSIVAEEYGELEVDEVEILIRKYKRAVEVVKVLTETFC